MLPLCALIAVALEPALHEVQEAAARAAAGDAGEDAARVVRARRAHLAPVLHLQGQLKEDERTRRGEIRLAPLREDDAGQGRGAALTLIWDLPQLIYSREEGTLALVHEKLGKARRDAAEKAARLWLARKRAQLALPASAPGRPLTEARCALLVLTAELDALTGGLFREAVSREERACAEEQQ